VEGNNSKENKEQSGLAAPAGAVLSFLNRAVKATLMMAASRSSNC
jgi:hypothetical protein